MSEPTSEELQESLELLSRYRDRLRNEVISMSKKLRLPNQKINSSLENHPELKKINNYIEKLNSQEIYKHESKE